MIRRKDNQPLPGLKALKKKAIKDNEKKENEVEEVKSKET